MHEVTCGREIKPEDYIAKMLIEISEYGVKQYIRYDNSAIPEMMKFIEKHFELNYRTVMT